MNNVSEVWILGYGSRVVVNKEPGNSRLRDCWGEGSGDMETNRKSEGEMAKKQTVDEGENRNCNINVMTPLNILCRHF